MSDLKYTVEYFLIPHPFKEEDYIVRGDEYQFQKILQHIYPLYKNTKYNFPRIERKIFSPLNFDKNLLEQKVKRYERDFIRREKNKINLKILKVWIRMGIGFSLSYIIWTLFWDFPFIHSVIDSWLRAVGDFLSTYAMVVIILAPSIASLYFSLTGKNSLLRLYRWKRPLDLYQLMGKDHTLRFIQDIKLAKQNLQKKVKKGHPVVGEMDNLIEILYRKEKDKIQNTLQNILNLISRDEQFPWGEKKNLMAMVEDILYNLKNDFKFAPLRIISSGERNISFKEEQKLKSLSHFFTLPEFIKNRESIIKRYASLKVSYGRESIKISDEISFLFQQMIFLSSRYHLGEIALPYERGVILKNLYYYLFVKFGRVSNYLRRKKGKKSVSRWLIKKLTREIDLLFNLNRKKINGGILRFVENPAGGILTSLAILVVVALLTGFHILKTGQFFIIHSYRFGYQGFLGEEVLVKDFSYPAFAGWRDFKLYWYPPKPFAFIHRIDLNRTYYTDVFTILKETEPSGIFDRFFHIFREEWGKGYSGINLRFSYRVVDPDLWANYDYDRKGSRRLSRDLDPYVSQYIERNKVAYREKLYKNNPDQLKNYFKKCIKQGKVSEWMRRVIYPSLLDVYRTGSMYERYLTGLRWLEEHPRMKDKPEWRKFVEHEIKNIEKLEKEQHEELICQPLKVKKMINKPTISALQKYDNLYRTLIYLAVDDFINEKIIKELSSFPSSRKTNPITAGIVKWLHDESRIEQLVGIKITGVRASIKRVSTLEWQNELRQMQNLI